MTEFNDITYQRDDIYCFDIDGTICDTPPNVYPWNGAVPRMSRIKKINELYDEGATIYLMTARGFIHSSAIHDNISDAQTEADNFARNKTEAQLTKWGVKYHKLYFGKPRAVTYVDDRAVSDLEFFQD
tara:strand:- start:64 stop:447 length:384 start_codon:yes stop_codon:yes gene_type:complete